MKSRDVIALYALVHIGTPVMITEKPLDQCLRADEKTLLERPD